MKRLRVYLTSGAALATIAIAVVTVMSYLESSAPVPDGTTENLVENSAPVPDGATENPVENSAPVPDGATENPAENSAPVSAGATENPVENDAGQFVDEVLIGYSVEVLRKKNNVREMMELEDGQSLSDANGVYGFVYGLSVFRGFISRSPHDFDPLLHRNRRGNDIEIHKTPSRETMLLLYVDEGSVARLAGIDQVGDIFVFFSPHKAHNVLVAVPINRIVNWDYRVSDPSFAKVRIN